jgi:excinuclease ABC subunit C
MTAAMRLKDYERKHYKRQLLELDYSTELSEKIKAAPHMSGCYLFIDKLGNTIYVGKAKDLSKRVKSYFTKAAREDERIADLVTRIDDVSFQVTASELDALLLEYHLIKQSKPWFNSQMKPDKTHPYLRIADTAPYPTLSITSQVLADGAEYFDCFGDSDDIKRTLTLFCRTWGVAQCAQSSFLKPKGPCIYHKLDGCLAPCSGQPDHEEYRTRVQEVIKLLTGQPVSKLADLKLELEQAVLDLDFEQAQSIKPQIEALELMQKRSRKHFHFPETGAVLVLIRPYRQKAFAVFLVIDKELALRRDFETTPSPTQIRNAFSVDKTSPSQLTDDFYADWLPDALIEVATEKQFIQLPDAKTSAKLIEKTIKEFAKGR